MSLRHSIRRLSRQLAVAGEVAARSSSTWGGASLGKSGFEGSLTQVVDVSVSVVSRGGTLVGSRGGVGGARTCRGGFGFGFNRGGFAAPRRRGYSDKSSAKGTSGASSESAAASEASSSSSSTTPPNPLANRETTRTVADNPIAGIMFPWERAVLSGERSEGPMTGLQKFYWVVFAGAVAFLVANRANQYYKSLKTKEELAEELAENRRAMQQALEGKSFIDKEDPFEGMEPHEIEAFLKKQAPDGDPYAGMTPEEINAYLHKTQEESVKKNISLPKSLPKLGGGAGGAGDGVVQGGAAKGARA